MTLFTWILIIGILLLVGNWLTRYWERRQQATTTEQATPEATPNLVNTYTTALRAQLATMQANILGRKQPEKAAKFRMWIATLTIDANVQQWLMTLSDEQLEALLAHITPFAHEMGFELSWLLDQEVAQQPTLARALTTVIGDYCRACYHAVELQEELEVYKALRAYEQNPQSAQNRQFGQAIFGKLMEQGLTSIKVADHLALPEQQRHQQIAETIQQIVLEKRVVVQRIVQQLLHNQHNAEADKPLTPAALNGTAKA